MCLCEYLISFSFSFLSLFIFFLVFFFLFHLLFSLHLLILSHSVLFLSKDLFENEYTCVVYYVVFLSLYFIVYFVYFASAKFCWYFILFSCINCDICAFVYSVAAFTFGVHVLVPVCVTNHYHDLAMCF